MPLYEYQCTACHKRTEKIQKFSDAEITNCPKCGGVLERVISAPAISFKGGGWFADGYGNAKPQASGSSEGGKTDGGSLEAGKSEAKPSSEAPSSVPAPAPASAPTAAPAASAPSAPAASKS